MISKMKPAPFSAEQARELFDYNPDTGALTWRVRRSPVAGPGTIAGCLNNGGYRRIGMGRQTFAAHRIIWLLVTGKWPDQLIDHINGIPDDNRWCNLREATVAQNGVNSRYRGPLPRGVSLAKGGKRFRSRLNRAKGFKPKDLGTYDTPEEAHQVWLAAARERYGEFVPH